MNRLKVLMFLGCVAASAPGLAQWAPGSPRSSLEDGNATVADLRYNYSAGNSHCGDSGKPPFLCSGVLMRVTQRPQNPGAFRIWDPSPTSARSGGTSFSYIRYDARFRSVAWGFNDGLIMYPQDRRPAGKDLLMVQCAYSMDGWNWFRNTPCGTMVYEGVVYPHSRPCQSQGVTTPQQWLGIWYQPAKYRPLNQCGFDMRRGVANSAGYFMLMLQMKNILAAEGFSEQNELVVTTWPAGRARTLPIQAFFYMPVGVPAHWPTGVPNGLAAARLNQKEFRADTGIIVPIVRLTPPANINDHFRFDFIVADQAETGSTGVVPPKPVPGRCPRYIDSVKWGAINGNQWSLEIKPSACTRTIAADQTDLAFQELLNKAGSDRQWSNTNSMRRQFVCLLTTYRTKASWFIEPHRPYVSHEAAVKANCNP